MNDEKENNAGKDILINCIDTIRLIGHCADACAFARPKEPEHFFWSIARICGRLDKTLTDELYRVETGKYGSWWEPHIPTDEE